MPIIRPSADPTFSDDESLKLGTDNDIVLLHRSTALSADDELDSVIVGTSDHPGVAANSLIISNITTDGDIMFAVSDGGNSIGLLKLNGSDNVVEIHGNLTVNGTTTTVNSTTTTIDDPIFTLGGDTAPGSDDNKDRGIEFRYYDSQARIGFFGYDDSAGVFTGFTAAANSSEVFSGTVIGAAFGAITAGGILKTDDTTAATSTTDGSLQTDGGLSVVLDAVIGDDVFLLSDSAVFNMGAGSDFKITHDGTEGATLTGNPITITSAAAATWSTSAGVLTIDGDDGIVMQNTGSGNITLAPAGELILGSATGVAQMQTNGLTMGFASSAPAPDNNQLHLWKATAGSVTGHADALLVLEDDGDVYINLLGGNASVIGLMFGSATGGNNDGQLFYEPNADRWSFSSGTNNHFMRMDASDLAFNSAQTISTTAGALTIDPATDTLFGNGTGVVVGHTAQVVTSNFLQNVASGVTAELQVLGNGVHDMAMVIGAFNTNDDYPATLTFLKSGSGTIGTVGVVSTDEIIGSIAFCASDTADFRSMAAAISVAIDDPSDVGENDTPGRIMFWTTPDGSAAPSERWRITSVGALTSLTAAPANAATTDGGITATGVIAFTDVANDWIDDATHGAGTVTHYIGNQTITTSSDSRVKTDWEPWEGSALDVISPAQLGKYRYNLPGGGSQTEGYGPNARGEYLGFKAQDTIKWAPWIVNAGAGVDCPQCVAEEECAEHSYWHVEYQHLVPILVKAIQELKEKVEALGG